MPSFPIYHKCNNNCIMCTNQASSRKLSKKYFSLSYLTNRIKRFYDGEKEFIDDYRDTFSLTGGEPTLNPCFLKIIKKINAFFPRAKINLLTNGKMFVYEDYAKKVLSQSNNLELCVSLHGHTDRLHDKITQTKNSFKEAINGIENIISFKNRNHLLEIRIVVHKMNYKFLDKIIKFIKTNFPDVDRVVLLFMELEGVAIRNFNTVKLSYKQLAPYINRIYNQIENFADFRLYHFPLCVLPVKFFPYTWRTLPSFEIDFPKNCNKCTLRQLCLGVHKGYLKHMGNSEFVPFREHVKICKSDDWYHPILEAN